MEKKNNGSWDVKIIWNSHFSVYKVLLEHSHIIYAFHGCFHATTVELSSCDRDLWPTKSKIVTICFFTKMFIDTLL